MYHSKIHIHFTSWFKTAVTQIRDILSSNCCSLLLTLRFMFPFGSLLQTAPGSRSLLPPCPHFPQWMSSCSKDCLIFMFWNLNKYACPRVFVGPLFCFHECLTSDSTAWICVSLLCIMGRMLFLLQFYSLQKCSWFLYFLCLVISSLVSVKSLLVKIVLTL